MTSLEIANNSFGGNKQAICELRMISCIGLES